MSRDLLADLDSFYQPSQGTKNVPQATAQVANKPNTSHTDDFLDFGSWGEAPAVQAVTENAFGDWGSTTPALHHGGDVQASNEDDFGDFESGEADETSMNTGPGTNDSWSNLAGTPATLPVVSSVVQPAQPEQQQYFPRPSPLHEQKQKKPKKAKAALKSIAPRDPNVFFDAENDAETDEGEGEDDDDDFGSFAIADEKMNVAPSQLVPPLPPPVSSSAVQKQLSLLDFDEDDAAGVSSSAMNNGFGIAATTASTTSVSAQAASDSGWVAFETQTAPTPIRTFRATSKASSKTMPQPSRQTAPQPPRTPIPKSISTSDDAWDDFESAPIPAQTPQITINPSSTTTTISKQQPPPSTLPPSNLPPPSVLLSLFPPLIKSATTQLFAHLSDKSSTSINSSTRTAILSHPTTTAFLASYLATCVVLARIIAGRKLRWKRDTHLSQNMRIGSASASRSGMKLAGVDKAEVSKEDREVADVLRLWRAQVGKLRSAVSSANANGARLPAIPELGETMVVRVAKESEGGVGAVKQCVVCALKRDERVGKVDGVVEDVFGEWWVEHWGHRSCVAFWKGHEGGLRSR